jgi:acyl-CoA synthetase (AMP-forming)/AMP-acid ligase II
VTVVDRLKDVINRGGYKVFSAEVEAVLARHPAVVESAVVGRECSVLGERVHAFVAVHSLTGTDANSLREHCVALLSDYKVPETFEISVHPLPRNPNGKILKRQLRESVPPYEPV